MLSACLLLFCMLIVLMCSPKNSGLSMSSASLPQSGPIVGYLPLIRIISTILINFYLVIPDSHSINQVIFMPNINNVSLIIC